jgi:type 1 fimbriae regulatory protein FimE
MSKTALHVVRTEPAPNAELDTRDLKRAYLTEDEVERIIKATSNERDRCMILMGYRHGLRVSELIGLQWRQIDLDAGHIRVLREKQGADSVHPISGREVRLLRKLRRSQPVGARFVFATSHGSPMTRNGFYKLLEKAGRAAGIDEVHPHLLRHGCGFRLVNRGMDTLSLAAYLGHVNVQNTQRYARMSATRFDGLWKD